MIYKSVEKIQEKISCIGIGCWNFGGDWDSSAEENSISGQGAQAGRQT